MIIPMTIQIAAAIHVYGVNCVIKKIHNMNEMIGTIGKNGTLKRSFGKSLRLRKNNTPSDTTVNANNVPILTRAAS